MDVLIVGASVRAAAWSARRAGLRPHGIDLFADCDTRAVGSCRRIDREHYPGELANLADQEPPGPWLYTGALENHPELLERLEQRRPLWGNAAAAVRAVRDPFRMHAELERAGIPVPAVRPVPGGLPRTGSWLVKPLASAGGRGIELLRGPEARSARASYYQERIEGMPRSAVYLASRSGCTLVGATWQWVGLPWAPFAYRGSIGPWPLDALEHARFTRLGEVVAEAFGLVGLFGIDVVLRDRVPWPVEVNPRYTASVEVLELALGRALLAEHAGCFPGGSTLPLAQAPVRLRSRFVGKAILFAPRACRFPNVALELPARRNAFPQAADLPEPGTLFQAGEPVLTLFAHANAISVCQTRLVAKLQTWTARLEPLSITIG